MPDQSEAPAPAAQPTAPVQPGPTQVHPLAALQEAAYDNEVARNRRLMLANDIHILTQMVGQREATIEQQAGRIKEMEAELTALKPAEAPAVSETEKESE